MFSPKPELKIIFLETTTACNLNCVHCRRKVSHFERQNGELIFKQITDLIDEVVDFAKPFIVLSGGEPLLRNDIFEIARYIKSKNLKVGLATNAVLIDELKAEKIKQAKIDIVSVSIDSIDESAHDAFRNSRGAFKATLEGIRLLKKHKIAFQINTTVTKHNYLQIAQMTTFSKNLGASALHLFILVPVGCGKKIPVNDMLSSRECEGLLRQVFLMNKNNDFNIRPTCAPFFARISDDNSKTKAGGCLAGKSIIFVSSTGEVFPCGYFDRPVANIKNIGLKKIWQENSFLKKLRDPLELKGKCSICEYKISCGGCRARAFAQTGDYFAQDPVCNYAPAKLSEIKK